MSSHLRPRELLLLIAPALVILGVLAIYPLARNLLLSFYQTDYGFEGAVFVGLANYEALLGDYFFNRALINTVFFTVVATGFEIGLGLALAMLVNRQFAGRRFVTPAIILPYVLSTMVVTSIWRVWFNYEHGVLNAALNWFGMAGVEWLTDRNLAMWSLIGVDVWQTTPIAFLVLLAGLQSVPDEIIEAAKIDGAGKFKLFATIVLPMLMPHLLLATLLRCVESFKIFDKAFALTGGGPGNATSTLSMFIHQLGFRFFEIGKASAAAIIMVALAAVLASIYASQILRQGDER